jgi:lipopolysaccharide export system permease protein
VLNLKEPAEVVGYKRKAAANSVLWNSSAPADVAELQWRLSRGLATLLLALLAIPLSHVSPRHGRNERAFMAAVVFAIYYNLGGLAHSWVEHDVVAAFPGVWWLHAVMFLLVIMFLLPELRGNLARRP